MKVSELISKLTDIVRHEDMDVHYPAGGYEQVVVDVRIVEAGSGIAAGVASFYSKRALLTGSHVDPGKTTNIGKTI